MEGVRREERERILRHGQTLARQFKLDHIEPRSIVKLDDDVEQAMEKMQRIEETLAQLPGVDCGLCGCPTCEALAHDVVLRGAEINRCIFLQRRQERLALLNVRENLRRMIRVWGEDKLEE
jgi:ArsR family metal-binding transcriptional regulator